MEEPLKPPQAQHKLPSENKKEQKVASRSKNYCSIFLIACSVVSAFLVYNVSPHAIGVSLEIYSAPINSTATMAAVTYDQPGPPEVLQFDPACPRPSPRSNQVLVHISAAAINPCDFKMRRSPLPWPLSVKPKIPGEDLAGVVVSGPENSRFKPGDRVVAMLDIIGTRWGSAAEYAAVPEDFLALVPEKISLQHAASVPLVALTTIQAFNRVEGGIRGKKILIHAGAGGVGSFAIQYARAKGATEIATTCSQAKADFVKSLGANVVIDYRTTAFEDVVEEYDVVLDTMSFLYEERTLNSNATVLAKEGHYLNIASSDWSLSSEGKEIGNGATTLKNLLASTVGNMFASVTNTAFANEMGWERAYSVVTVVPNGNQLEEVMSLMSDGQIEAVIDRTFPLSDAATAHKYIEKGTSTGKVMLDVESFWTTTTSV